MSSCRRMANNFIAVFNCLCTVWGDRFFKVQKKFQSKLEYTNESRVDWFIFSRLFLRCYKWY